MFNEKRLKKIISEIRGLSRKRVSCDMEVLAHHGKTHRSFLQSKEKEDWMPFGAKDRWGLGDGHCWFRVQVVIPEAIDGMGAALVLSTGHEGEWDDRRSQFLAFVEGNPVEAMDLNHREFLLDEAVKAGQAYRVDLEGFVDAEGFFESDTPEAIPFQCILAGVDRSTEKLYYHMDVLYKSLLLMDENDVNRIEITGHLLKALDILDLRYPYTQAYYQAVEAAIEYLEREAYGKDGNGVTLTVVGHTHIDVAWLWDLEQTREKVVRSFSSMLKLLERYPQFTFMSSQPQLYQYLKEDYPDVYEKVRDAIRSGRWEAEGAMWLEADANVPSGESLVRQIIHGKTFFKQEFGIDSKILWLPDVFGYSAALPQIMKKAGIQYFMTTKISWSEYNKMPYDTFYWEGIDGARILTHFITATSDYDLNPNLTAYTGMLTPKHVKGTWERYQQKELSRNVLMAYGYGDGGGGTTPEMIETAIRFNKGIQGMAKVEFGTARSYFEQLEASVKDHAQTPAWVGELYLEFHRGTYTSMARNKRYNRKSEQLYLDAELYAVIDKHLTGSAYPAQKLHDGWETILLNQFHDILPGSSIKRVYDQSKIQYEHILEEGRKLVDGSTGGIAAKTGGRNQVVVFNSLGFDRDGVVELPIQNGLVTSIHDEFKSYPVQKLSDSWMIAWVEGVPSKGFKAFSLLNDSETQQPLSGLKVSPLGMSNEFFSITFDGHYNIVSIFDKRFGREVLKAGQTGNRLLAFEDKPYEFDAWDISIYYQSKQWEIDEVLSAEVVEEGPVRGCLEIRRRFMESVITQRIYIYSQIPVIDFDTEIDWKQEHILLKAAFPVDVHTSKATYEIQYGNVERPTHWNTSWDKAKFEVCGHKWCDLSEDGYGVSLLNDCKYGYDVKDGVMRLTLLKSATWPNPDADREQHRFVYSLYPHAGDFKAGGTVRQAYALNDPLKAVPGGDTDVNSAVSCSFVSVDQENVMIEVVKESMDGEGVIVRLYEYFNRRAACTLRFAFELKEVHECSLMEEAEASVPVTGEQSFQFEILPYEIKTFRIKASRGFLWKQ